MSCSSCGEKQESACISPLNTVFLSHIDIVAPMTSCPCFCNIVATTEESTPPLMPTKIFICSPSKHKELRIKIRSPLLTNYSAKKEYHHPNQHSELLPNYYPIHRKTELKIHHFRQKKLNFLTNLYYPTLPKHRRNFAKQLP